MLLGCGEAGVARPARPAPAFALTDLQGKTVSLADFAGRTVVIDFWATWCIPCKKQIPVLNAFHESPAGRDVALLGIAVDADGSEVVAPFAAEHRIQYPVLLGDEVARLRLRGAGFPGARGRRSAGPHRLAASRRDRPLGPRSRRRRRRSAPTLIPQPHLKRPPATVETTAVDSAALSGSATPELGETALGVRRDFERVAQAGESIFESGEPADAFYVLLAGEVLLLDTSRGGVSRLVARLGPGDSVGETDSLLGRARGARAVAATDARLLRLDRATFRSMCLERPDIAVQVIERLAQRSADLERRLAALGMNDLVRPVARGLLECAAGAGGPVGVSRDDLTARTRGSGRPFAARNPSWPAGTLRPQARASRRRRARGTRSRRARGVPPGRQRVRRDQLQPVFLIHPSLTHSERVR